MMNTVQRIFKNTGVLLISQFSSYILGFFYVLYTARYLGAEGFGILSFALAFSGILGILADFGLSTLTTREVARNKSLTGKYLANTSLMRIFSAIFTFVITILIVNIIGYPQNIIYVVYFVVIYTLMTTFSQMFYSIFQTYEEMEYQSIGTVLNSVLLLGGTLFAISYGWDVVGLASIYLFVGAVTLIYNVIICSWKFIVPKIEFDPSFWKSTLKEAWPFGLTGFAGMIYTYIDSVMLQLIQGNEVVGWYNAAYRLMLVFLFIPIVINLAVFPVMSRLYSSSENSLKLMYEKYFKFMIMVGIPLGVGTTILADKIIILIFGTGYLQSIIALQILIWTTVITFSGAAFVRLFEATNRQLTITKISGMGVVVNILLNLLLIPKFSYVGASVATVITEIMVVGSVFGVSYKIGYVIERKKLLNDILKITMAALIMGVFIWYFRDLTLLLLVPSAALTYLGLLYLIGGIDREDINLLKLTINWKGR
jgi:O-antigen/teichoic acid export membrane protein